MRQYGPRNDAAGIEKSEAVGAKKSEAAGTEKSEAVGTYGRGPAPRRRLRSAHPPQFFLRGSYEDIFVGVSASSTPLGRRKGPKI